MSCDNVPTTAEIEQAKKDVNDFNTFMTSTSNTFVDSRGILRLTLQGAIDEFGFGIADFTFTEGGTLLDRKLLISNDPVDAFLYRYIGSSVFPVTITAGTNPVSNPDWEAFTATSAEFVSNANGGSVQDFIDAQYTTVAEIATGKFQVGSYVRPTDRDLELFEILASGVVDELGIIDAGDGKVAIYRPKMTINPKAFGAKYDGVTLDTAANNQASIWSTALLIPVKSPLGVTLTGQITYYHKFQWFGSGMSVSIFKAAPGGTSDIFVSADFDTLTGTNSDDGVYEPVIEDLSIDGNRDRPGNASGITTGKGLKFYGRTNRFRRLKIYHCAEEGLISEWGEGANLTKGLEGIFEDIECYYNGKDGWTFMGPHDSHCFDIFCHSNSQSDSSVYENLAVKKGNARWSRVHTYSLFYTDQGFPSESARQKTSLHVYREAEGNEFSQCHIEGGDVNYHNEANGTKLWGSRIYYPWNGVNIINEGSSVTIEATLGEEFKGIGLPLAKGLLLGGTYGGPSNCTFDLSGSGMEAGWVDFDGSNGANSFVIRGYNATMGNTAYIGQPHSTDDVDLYVSGPNLVSLKHEAFQTRNAVGEITATGSNQTDSALINSQFRTVSIIGGGNGSGVRLENSAFLGDGHKLQVSDVTGFWHYVYPPAFANFQGYGVNNPIKLGPLMTAEFTVSDGDVGDIIVNFTDMSSVKAYSPDGTLYKLVPPNGGGAAVWVAV